MSAWVIGRHLRRTGVRSKLDAGDGQRAPGDLGTTAFALFWQKSAGTSNLRVCISYRQRQPCSTLVCMGLRLLI